MNKRKKRQLIIVCVIFLIILGAYLGFKFYMNHLPEDNDDENLITVTDIDTSLITEIGIINGEDSLDLQKDGDVWISLSDDTLSIDTDKLQSFLDAAGNITSELMIEEVTDMSQYGLEDPAVNITLQWDSNLYVIKIGDQNSVAGGFYYISINDEDIVYTIDSTQYYNLNKTTDDFIAEEEEEEEETEETEEAVDDETDKEADTDKELTAEETEASESETDVETESDTADE